MKVFIFGNGNISFDCFIKLYVPQIDLALEVESNSEFILCEFRGVDTLAMEYLKDKASNVTVLHIGDRPRYKPDAFKTKVGKWTFKGGFESDLERDMAAIELCTHFIAFDFNSDEKRVSGTAKNIEKCLDLSKKRLM